MKQNFFINSERHSTDNNYKTKAQHYTNIIQGKFFPRPDLKSLSTESHIITSLLIKNPLKYLQRVFYTIHKHPNQY